jgi:hypothetical protein
LGGRDAPVLAAGADCQRPLAGWDARLAPICLCVSDACARNVHGADYTSTGRTSDAIALVATDMLIPRVLLTVRRSPGMTLKLFRTREPIGGPSSDETGSVPTRDWTYRQRILQMRHPEFRLRSYETTTESRRARRTIRWSPAIWRRGPQLSDDTRRRPGVARPLMNIERNWVELPLGRAVGSLSDERCFRLCSNQKRCEWSGDARSSRGRQFSRAWPEGDKSGQPDGRLGEVSVRTLRAPTCLRVNDPILRRD